MAEAPDPAMDQEFDQLIGFLQDQRLDVQKQAAEGVLSMSENQEFLGYCQRFPRRVAKPLMRLVERAEAATASSTAGASAGGTQDQRAARQAALEARDAEEAGAAALQAVVNLSTVPAIRDALIALNAPRRALESLRSGWLEGRAGLAHWYAMLLANLTTVKAGQEALCEDQALLRFLLAAFVAKPRPPPRDGYDDPLMWLGRALGNVCALPAGRSALSSGEQGAATVATLVVELSERSRRPDVLTALRNLCLDTECHLALVQTDIVPRLARFVYPWEKVEAEMRNQLPDALRESLEAEGAAMTGDVAVRFAAAVCLLGLVRSLEGREYLRAAGCREVVRAWSAEESEEDIKAKLQTVWPAVHFSEEELEAEIRRRDGGAAETPAEATVATPAEATDAGAASDAVPESSAPMAEDVEPVC